MLSFMAKCDREGRKNDNFNQYNKAKKNLQAVDARRHPNRLVANNQAQSSSSLRNFS